MSLHSVEREIVKVLLADDDVMTRTAGRVYFGLRPQDDIDPAINFLRSRTEQITALRGRVCVAKATFQVSCWAINLTEAVDLRLYAKRALMRLPGSGAGGVVQSVLPGDEMEMFQNNTKDYRALLEIEVMFNEPI